jgi:HPt (histidine-containing phosphotransfer) domain-containing protein
MNAPASPADILDEAALNDLKDMLGDALTDIAQSFLEGLDAEVDAIRQGMGAGGPATKAAAHSLKGSAGNMGCRVLSGFAAQLEKAAIDGQMARCEELLPQLVVAAAEARVALQAYIARG